MLFSNINTSTTKVGIMYGTSNMAVRLHPSKMPFTTILAITPELMLSLSYPR